MDGVAYNKLLLVTPQQFQEVRNSYDVTKETINRDLDALIEWYKFQPHLPQIEIDRKWLERLFVINKCSMERSKQRLDMIFASRNKMADLFTLRNPTNIVTKINKSMVACTLPHLSKDNTRVVIGRILLHDPENFDFLEYFKLLFMINEYRQHHDYCMGDRYIIDFKDMSLGYYLKMYPTTIKKAEAANKQVFGSRIYGFHLVNPTPIMEKVINVMKMAMSEKLGSRIQVHPTLEDLHKHISKEILPEEYGGTYKKDNLTIYEEWSNLMLSNDFSTWIVEQDKLKSDESKRPGQDVESDLFGIPGSFRGLKVD